MDDVWIAVFFILMFGGLTWALYRSQRDSGFDAQKPHGDCQKWIGRNVIDGYDTYCGKKTNRQFGDKWLCKVHNPSDNRIGGA